MTSACLTISRTRFCVSQSYARYLGAITVTLDALDIFSRRLTDLAFADSTHKNIHSHASSDTSCYPPTWNFRQFAAGNFKDIVTDACSSGRVRDTLPSPPRTRGHVMEQETDTKLNRNAKQKVKNVLRTTDKTEEILSALEKLFPTNRTVTSSREGVYELQLLPNVSAKGAVCLDGSPPGFYLRNGTGLGNLSGLFFSGGCLVPRCRHVL
ncbi:hypothetical protein OS493_013318 [Desmophyllum pertusum]|uniref:Uncharacterized protein n=1 Tax=Desmophyllum pertusum TaxID=174260 RepID=A0A9X0CEX3_9CNID|nr:hypothetical protein OS493_013318 [Desmophyllum pertusum]